MPMQTDYTEKLKKIESYLEHFLPQMPDISWQEQCFLLQKSLPSQSFAGLIPPCTDLISRGGKRWRPLLLVLCAEAGAVQTGRTLTEQVYALTPLVEFAHTASLIHDDIEDAADKRRGEPAIHIRYGIDTALNAGSWLYFQAPCCIETAQLSPDLKLALYTLYTAQIRRLHLGQALDIEWHKNNEKLPTVDEYTTMVTLKTGTLSALAAGIGTLVGSASKDMAERASQAAADIGVAFQILDDIINLTTGNPGKKRGDDIVEGKKSLPLLLHIQSHPEHMQQIMAYLQNARSEGICSPSVEHCISLITTGSALTEAKQRAQTMIKHACNEFAYLFPAAGEQIRSITDLFEAMIPQ